MIVNIIEFPKQQGLKCNMMPFIQGDSSSLPKKYKSYSKIIDENFLEKGEVGFLTIDESFVNVGGSQRGYNSFGMDRNVHVEVGITKHNNVWGYSWGGSYKTTLNDDTFVLICNSISDTCRYWDTIEKRYTRDGDLSQYIDSYPEETGILMKKGELAKISIFTPHECIPQKESAHRQFFRIVGKGVKGREDYFTKNELVTWED